MTRLKSEAALAGKTLREHCIDQLSAGVKEAVKPARHPDGRKAGTTPLAWCPTSMCPHNFQNSFVCEKARGGCIRPTDR